jgi:hypothetical protein
MKSILKSAQVLLAHFLATFREALRGTLPEMLREIFDEASYTRFLRSAQMPSSPQAYAAFWREREAGHARRPRCC